MLTPMPIQQRLDQWAQRGLTRVRHYKTSTAGIDFRSNDYLGLSQHPQVRRAFGIAARQYGLGSGSSALVAGYHSAHALLEERLAHFLQRDRAILFNSGYHANLGVLTALAQRDSFILLDKLCHASIIDAVLLSRARYRRYAHRDMRHLKNYLNSHCSSNTLIVSESVFSMSGDIAPVVELVQLAERFKSTLILDDAHGLGILGLRGRGICEHAQLNQAQVPVLVAPLGKAFGSLGAVVAGHADLIEACVQFARTYRYTTALPPAIAQATLQSLILLETETWRRERLNELVRFFVIEAKKRSLTLLSQSQTPIQSILMGDNERTLSVQKKLSVYGIAVAAIRPPTVPINTARLRISLNCNHTEAQILRLLDLLAELK